MINQARPLHKSGNAFAAVSGAFEDSLNNADCRESEGDLQSRRKSWVVVGGTYILHCVKIKSARITGLKKFGGSASRRRSMSSAGGAREKKISRLGDGSVGCQSGKGCLFVFLSCVPPFLLRFGFGQDFLFFY